MWNSKMTISPQMERPEKQCRENRNGEDRGGGSTEVHVPRVTVWARSYELSVRGSVLCWGHHTRPGRTKGKRVQFMASRESHGSHVQHKRERLLPCPLLHRFEMQTIIAKHTGLSTFPMLIPRHSYQKFVKNN